MPSTACLVKYQVQLGIISLVSILKGITFLLVRELKLQCKRYTHYSCRDENGQFQGPAISRFIQIFELKK